MVREQEHKAYGFDFPPLGRRFDLLEDALQVFPLMWGPGAPAFEGKVVTVAEALCYPRPLQERIPILVGGSGERRTLRLVAQYADACNLFGDAATVAHKVGVLRAHCTEVGRAPSAVQVTHLSSAQVAGDPPADVPQDRTPTGTVEDHVGRYRELAEAGVQTEIVRLATLDEESIAGFAPVVAAFGD
ncbi:MAG: LLM class flavin-dependent oxidoreductase [Acidimicrobiales bacterium]